MKYLIFVFLFVVFNAHASSPTHKNSINIGVLSFRPVNENQKIWLPLGEELHKYAPAYDFNITSYPQKELVKMISKGIFDFAIVHPAAFIELENKYGVTNIASLVRQPKNGKQHLKVYGGVVATLASNQTINTLQDINGKTIATTHVGGLAVMLIQQDLFYNAGIDITKDCKILVTGQPMDKVVKALKSYKADVGFFRTGYIEELISRGKLKKNELKIINKIKDDYPYAHSTPLYPEWAVLATSKPNEETVKAVTTALYQISSETNLDYHEFTIPLSYKTTRELMQKYHVYPFEATKMSFQELIHSYALYIVYILLFLVLGAIVMAVIYRLQMIRIKKQAQQLETILSTASDGIHVHDTNGNLLMFSNSFANMLGYTNKELSKLRIYDWDQNFNPSTIAKIMKNALNNTILFETVHTKKDNKKIDVEIFAKGIVIDGRNYIYSSARDITDRKNNEIKLLKHKTIFDNIAEGVYAVDRYNICNYINHAALNLLDLTQEEIIGKNPHVIFHNTKDPAKCRILEAVHSGQAQNIEDSFTRKDGSSFPVMITVSPIIKDKALLGSVITFIDISKQKADQKTLIKEKERFDYLAHYDILTKLPNRLSLIEHLEQKCLKEENFAFMFIDLDGFKEINDSYGHRFGDKLLIKVALLLKKLFPSNAFTARTGGDEFVVCIHCEDQRSKIDIYMNNLIDTLNHPFNIDDKDIYITASVGIAIYPIDAKTTEELMQNADAAMYNAKKMGRNTFSFYDESLTKMALQKTTIVSKLKKAISNNELTMYLQPQVDPYTNKIVGAESLIRWFGKNETVSPALFIPIAEETGLILEIGAFVLKESLIMAKKLHEEKKYEGKIAINISARQLIHPEFLSLLEKAMIDTECSPQYIELEITETSILEDPKGMIELLNKLKEKDFHISIDDFGTGYSSMSYLKNLPIDKLKIDQSFIRDILDEPKNQTIVKTVIALARGLDMKVLAEGVESKEELKFLEQYNIDIIQGYYYHKPMSFEEFTKLL